MHAPAQRLVAREALRQARARRLRLLPVRVRRDDRGAGLDGRVDRLLDAVLDGDEASEPDRDRVSGLGRVRMD
ncbi:MAG TPA: hypothetical protein VI540_05510 [Gaiellaceae bacterium]|nr:hypothetical protein [Gaiellaceae bacterium]